MTRDWQNVIFSDESAFWAFSPQRKVWSVRGKLMLQRSVKHPLKCIVELANALTLSVNLHRFSVSCEALQLFVAIYTKRVLDLLIASGGKGKGSRDNFVYMN
ncbi:hypothetical protein Trydic_g15786 [Trypoxylus dichotomus]